MIPWHWTHSEVAVWVRKPVLVRDSPWVDERLTSMETKNRDVPVPWISRSQLHDLQSNGGLEISQNLSALTMFAGL